MALLMTMAEIARLANVQRQAVTNWRSRPAVTPFPTPVSLVEGVERFDRDEVLTWLEETGRGRNREARLDASAVSAPDDLDLERAVVFLTLRAKVAHDIGPLSAQRRIEVAEEIDPDDDFLLAEVRDCAQDSELSAYVDELLEASYGPADALARLYSTRPAQGTRGFAPELIGLMRSIVSVCRAFLGPDGVAIELRADGRARQIASGFALVSRDGAADRSMLRHLLLEGLAIDDADSPSVRALAVTGADESAALDLADEFAVDLGPRQVAVIVGPSTALCDRLVGDLYRARRKTLELGGLAAAFKLPRGLWRAAHRQSLGLWVLRGGDTSSRVLVADLSGRTVDPDELATDVLGALEQSYARAYRYGRTIAYNEVWTRDTVVVPGAGSGLLETRGSSSALDRAIGATLVTREPIDGFDITLAASAGATTFAPRSLGELVDGRAIQVQSGCRISTEDLDPKGTLPVLSADASVPQRRLDALVAADRYPHAARTEPGDVIFIATPAPSAVVDEEGGSRVASPSRILRVDQRRAGIGPRALAAAINGLAVSSEWRTWPVPHVPQAQIPQLEEALGAVLDHLAELRRHEQAAVTLIANVIQGVAEGSIEFGSTTEKKAG